jgi:hypothetical protein
VLFFFSFTIVAEISRRLPVKRSLARQGFSYQTDTKKGFSCSYGIKRTGSHSLTWLKPSAGSWGKGSLLWGSRIVLQSTIDVCKCTTTGTLSFKSSARFVFASVKVLNVARNSGSRDDDSFIRARYNATTSIDGTKNDKAKISDWWCHTLKRSYQYKMLDTVTIVSHNRNDRSRDT